MTRELSKFVKVLYFCTHNLREKVRKSTVFAVQKIQQNYSLQDLRHHRTANLPIIIKHLIVHEESNLRCTECNGNFLTFDFLSDQRHSI